MNIEVQEFEEKANVVGLIRNSEKIAGTGKRIALRDKSKTQTTTYFFLTPELLFHYGFVCIRSASKKSMAGLPIKPATNLFAGA